MVSSGDNVESIDKIFEHRASPAMIGYFEDEDCPESKAFYEFAKEVGSKNGFLFFISRVGSGADSLSTFAGVKEDKSVAILKGLPSFKVRRFIMSKKVTLENLRDFAADFKAGRIPMHTRSEEVPSFQVGPFFRGSRDTLHYYYPNQNRNLVIFFFDDACPKCPPVHSELT